MIMIKEHSIIMLLLILQGFAFQEKIYCVKSNFYQTSDSATCNCQSYMDWSTLTTNSSKFLTSYTKICFPFSPFNLSARLIINDVSNISLIGTNSDKLTSIKCFNNSYISISNATFVDIQNFELENCGIDTEQYIKVREAYAALLLYNVISVTIFGVTFKNSYGHSIIGTNLIESSVLQQILVLYMKDNSSTIKGGIVLMFSDEITNNRNHGKQQNILIKHCKIYYMNDTQDTTQGNMSLGKHKRSMHVLAIGLDFHQHKYSVNIKIVNVSIKDIKAQNGPLINILYNSTNISNVSIVNSALSKNNIYGYPIIEISNDMGGCRSCKSFSVFESTKCVLSYNKARTIFFVNHLPNSLHPMTIYIKITLTVFAYNQPEQDFWKIGFEEMSRYKPRQMINVSIKQCHFKFNSGFTLEFYNAGNVTLLDKNYFTNNSARNLKQPTALLKCRNTILIFQGYNEFNFNTAYWILDLSNYTILMEPTTINITQNFAVVPETPEYINPALIHFIDNNINHFCMFQFDSSLPKLSQSTLVYKNPTEYFNISIEGNKNYTSLVYGTQLNSCSWLNSTINFGNMTTGDVMANVLYFNKTSEQVIRRDTGTLCYCDNRISADCIKDHFKPIFPGQTIPISLKQAPPNSPTSIYLSVQSLQWVQDVEHCLVKPYQLNWLQSITNSCTPISYVAYSSSVKRCYVSFITTHPDESLYTYYIDTHENCPNGFNMIDGSCECDSKLKKAFPSITCNINTGTIIRPGNSWVGLSAQHEIFYVHHCAPFICQTETTSVQLNSSDTQCIYNRGGIACGECVPEFSVVFGSLRCKRCSNQWLFLTPAFLLAGLLLIFLLFALDLTIVDGKINGFILYINVITVNIQALFIPSSKFNIANIISLLNLDSPIETCFYHGMTEYDKTWLLFAFPSYLLFIVAMLAFASRYSTTVERLTRRRVIPVIATIFLFSYSKLLLIITKVLCSYTTVYHLTDNTKRTIWMWDTGVPLFGIKFSILFTASLLLVLVILLPLDLFLLFTKLPLRIRFLAKYLKPYLDVFQAPFKDRCHYFPGLELVIR